MIVVPYSFFTWSLWWLCFIICAYYYFFPKHFFQNAHVFLAELHSSDNLLALPSPWKGFPDCSADKESSCNAGDIGLIPRLGRSPREGIGCPLQYSWAFLVAQMVKNLPTMWETWVWSLGWEDPLGKGMATHSSILAWRIPRIEEPGRLPTIHGVAKSWIRQQLSLSLSY